jgi:hypothetical protein
VPLVQGEIQLVEAAVVVFGTPTEGAETDSMIPVCGTEFAVIASNGIWHMMVCVGGWWWTLAGIDLRKHAFRYLTNCLCIEEHVAG